MKALIRFIIIGALLYPVMSVIMSCSEEADCSMTARPMMKCVLYTIDEANVVHNDTLDSLTVTALKTDSVIINNQKRVHDLLLPLRYAVDSTVLVFHYSTISRDTLTIRQINTPYFLSMDCGYQMKQTIRSVSYTDRALDSIYISNNEANIYGTENLKLFY